MSMRYVINWELEPAEYARQIDDYLKSAEVTDSVIPLPIDAAPGPFSAFILSSLISQVKCDGCDARCCKSNAPSNEPIGLTLAEYKELHNLKPTIENSVRFCHEDGIQVVKMNYPCPFLENDRCTIYRYRPFICVVYPFQTGGAINNAKTFALASDCPEAKRLARGLFLYMYDLHRARKRVMR